MSSLQTHAILTHYQCPLEVDGTRIAGSPGPICTYYNLPFEPQARALCPFGHQNSSGLGVATKILREIPTYICFNYLCQRCQNPTEGKNSWDELVRCEDGFHPSMEELIDLDHLHQKMAGIVLAEDRKRKSEAGGGRGEMIKTRENSQPESTTTSMDTSDFLTPINPGDPTCAVCLEPIAWEVDGNFGLLQNCPHIFCADCILRWQQRPRTGSGSTAAGTRQTSRSKRVNRQCPVCRTESARVLITQRLPTNKEEKDKLFELQSVCFKLAGVKSFSLNSDSDSDSDSSSSDSDSSQNFGGISREFLIQLRAIMGHDRFDLWDDHDSEDEQQTNNNRNEDGSQGAQSEQGDHQREHNGGEEEDQIDGVEQLELDEDDASFDHHIHDLDREFLQLMQQENRGNSQQP